MQTPTSARKANKKLPLIVDIALDDNGKQLYQVHESSKLIRKEMPRSTRFNNQPMLMDDEDEEKTPIRKILGTISPSTLNQKKTADDDDPDAEIPEPESATRSSVNQMGSYFPDAESLGLDPAAMNEYNYSVNTGNTDDISGNNPDESDPNSDLFKNNDIWPDDVETAFEQVLSIIPKNGLNKIKISGRSCGRNELISDYILKMTGKFRTRKQVSSHIQVIKNLGQKHHIIKLINEGPCFRSEQEQIDNNKRFEEIFSKINLEKSLGFSEITKRKSADSGNQLDVKRSKRHSHLTPVLNLSVENFYMSIFDSLWANPIILTLQGNQEIQQLRLKPNANFSNRFPDLASLTTTNIPILHSLIKLQVPANLPANYSIEHGLKTNLFLRDDSNGTSGSKYSVFTVIYNYGKEAFKINENDIKFNDNLNFLTKFWKFYLTNELKSNNLDNLNYLTIKQILYETNDNQGEPDPDSSNGFKVSKLKIKSVFLWEFLKVKDLKDAVTSTSKLIFPNSSSHVPTAHGLFPSFGSNSNVMATMAPGSSMSMAEPINLSDPPVSGANISGTGTTANISANDPGSQIVPQVVDYPGPSSMYYGNDMNLPQSYSGMTSSTGNSLNVGLGNPLLSTQTYSTLPTADSGFFQPVDMKKKFPPTRNEEDPETSTQVETKPNPNEYNDRTKFNVATPSATIPSTSAASNPAADNHLGYSIKQEPGISLGVGQGSNEESFVPVQPHLSQMAMSPGIGSNQYPQHPHSQHGHPQHLHSNQQSHPLPHHPQGHVQMPLNPSMPYPGHPQFQSMEYEYPFLYDPNNSNYMNNNS